MSEAPPASGDFPLHGSSAGGPIVGPYHRNIALANTSPYPGGAKSLECCYRGRSKSRHGASLRRRRSLPQQRRRRVPPRPWPRRLSRVACDARRVVAATVSACQEDPSSVVSRGGHSHALASPVCYAAFVVHSRLLEAGIVSIMDAGVVVSPCRSLRNCHRAYRKRSFEKLDQAV